MLNKTAQIPADGVNQPEVKEEISRMPGGGVMEQKAGRTMGRRGGIYSFK